MIQSLRDTAEYTKEGIVYLDHAATGPLSRCASSAMNAYLEERTRYVPNNTEHILPRLESGRASIARLLGTSEQNVEYVPNTSHGINLLARGLDWNEGDRVAVAECEFPANLLPWLVLEKRGVHVDRIPCRDGVFDLFQIEQSLTPRTRVLSVSWVQFLSGFRAPLASLRKLCSDKGVLLAVDGIQGIGALEMKFDDLGIDFLACGGHKWLLGPQGSGFVAVSPRLLHQLEPVRGWLNGPVDWEDFGATGLDLHPDATRFRTGTLATGPLLGLIASVDQFLESGVSAVESAVLRAAAMLASSLKPLGLSRWGESHSGTTEGESIQSGIVTFEHPAPEAMREHLLAQDVWVSCRDRKLRFSPHATTSENDLDRAVEAVRAFGRFSISTP